MGGVGFVIALLRKGSGIGFSFAGIALSLVCLLFTWSSNQAASDVLKAIVEADAQPNIAPARNDLPADLPKADDAAPAGDAKIANAAKADDVRPPAKNLPQEKKPPLELLAWDFSVVKGDFGEHYEISYSLKNTADKAIKLIDGGLSFSDLLDERLYSIKIEPDLKIGAQETVKESGEYRINQFIVEENRMKKMMREDIKVRLRIYKVVFDDNTILNLSK